ncbi:GTP 3',8-cyclase MoaA [Geomonas paludis]|uniref:GTP 3',8-cyclase n=1 Tax=Geomonas paludis TaxID=2740185 RepID=A0A6V8MV06_9BACT|nr:GTP 3',8-cyclase MoaA [Geomonas paludis]UPU38078.1 GTP 3',8-cyclase MoaA [Geomonas paludis]GFO63393.1 GTP 3',8-cyclase [Geomonas paludis]
MSLVDTYGRRINYLRLSVTDRCNLRCSYCMPEEGVEKLSHCEMLSYEDLLRISAEAVAAGIEKIRVTGGEPLVRKGIVDFLGRLAALPGLKELVLTTNGLLLKEMAQGLRDAGVQRLNVSLDSLKPETFAAITRGGDLQRVLDGLDEAERVGFPPHKINVVVMRGVNDDEILDFVALTLKRPYAVRFIEYMPTCGDADWRDLTVPGAEIRERIAREYTIEESTNSERSGPSKNFRVQGAPGSLGIITAMTGHFCDGCNRLRVTASGVAKGCLFSGTGVDLKPVLATGDDELLRKEIRRIVAAKPGRHEVTDEGVETKPFAMSRVGG